MKIKKRKLAINRSLKLKPTAKFSMYGFMVLNVFLVLLMTIGYSAMATELNITGEASFRTEADIRITNNGVSGITNGGSILYNPDFSRDTIITGVNLPHLNSTVSFEITVTNFTNIPMMLESINNLNMTNPDITYTITGMSINDLVSGFETTTFTITFHYRDTVTALPANRNLESRIEFNFVSAVTDVTVTFNANGATSIAATSLTCSYTFPATSCSITAPTITRDGWIILGWNQDANATTSTWDVGASRSFSSNSTWHAITAEITDVTDFPYTGEIQSVTLQPGTYHLQVWGAGGGAGENMPGSEGGFSEGIVTFTTPTTVFIGVGGTGINGNDVVGGFNGGGNSGGSTGTQRRSGSGGGASHISLSNGLLNNTTVRNNILLVAGGGGGAIGDSTNRGGSAGVGGGIEGTAGVNTGTALITRIGGGAGTATSGGAAGVFPGNATTRAPGAGTAGQGGAGALQTNNYITGGGGGGGWFGGGGGHSSPAGGGSGHLSARMESGHGITARTIPGNQPMPNPNGGNMTGRQGNGFVRITLLEEYVPVQEFQFTGAVQTITLTPGTYRIEAWGAQGGTGRGAGVVGGSRGGFGGYAAGTYTINAPTTIHIAVGGMGGSQLNPVNISSPGGWNGGGASSGSGNNNPAGGGGGATHISLGTGVLTTATARNNILLVAGGGGGGGGNNVVGGFGGGTTGGTSQNGTWFAHGGTQTAGGTAAVVNSGGVAGGAGFGALGTGAVNNAGGGGGSGWFGGAAAASGGGAGAGGGGGSAHISSRVTGGQTIAGNASMPNPVGGTMIGNAGNGFVRITRL